MDTIALEHAIRDAIRSKQEDILRIILDLGYALIYIPHDYEVARTALRYELPKQYELYKGWDRAPGIISLLIETAGYGEIIAVLPAIQDRCLNAINAAFTLICKAKNTDLARIITPTDDAASVNSPNMLAPECFQREHQREQQAGAAE